MTHGQLLWCRAKDKAALQVVLLNGKGWICNGIWVEKALQMMYFLCMAHFRLGKFILLPCVAKSFCGVQQVDVRCTLRCLKDAVLQH